MERAQRIGALDGIRCFAVLLVIGVHVNILWPTVPKSIVPFKDGGFIGVDIFFVLSGFLISGLLLNEVQQTGRIRYFRFFARRVLRLLPPLLISMAFTLIWAINQGDDLQVYLKAVYAAIFNYANWFVLSGSLIPPQFGPLWSLSVEEQLYLLLAVIFLILSKTLLRSRLTAVLFWISLALIGWSIYSRFATAAPGWSFEVWQRLYFRTDHRFGEFFFGVIAQLYKSKHKEVQTRLLKVVQYPAILVLVYYATQMQGDMIIHYRYGSPILSLASACVILSSTYEKSPISRFFSRRVFVSIGRISYSMYLIHIPIFYALGSLSLTGPYKISMAMVFIFLYSIAVYFAVEKPLGKFRQKYLSN